MPVFSDVVSQHGSFLARALAQAAHELDLFGALAAPADLTTLADRLAIDPHRLRAALDALVRLGSLRRDGARYAVAEVPPPPEPLPPQGWGRLAEVLRSGRPLPAEPATRAAMHAHLSAVGAPEAEELARRFLGAARTLLDLGGGAGTYARAFLAAGPDRAATLVDRAETLALANDPPPGLTRVAGELPDALDGLPAHDAALLSNVLHLHGPARCAALVSAAARAVRPGGSVVVKDLYRADGPDDPPETVWFALNMALYTEGGDVHAVGRLEAWLRDAGLVDVEAARLDVAPESAVVVGRRP